MSQVIQVSEQNWEQAVLKSEVPVVVDFYASWCGPCKMLARVMDEVAIELAGKVKFVKVNVEEASSLAMLFQIRAVPTIAFISGGDVVEVAAGFLPAAELKRKASALLPAAV